MRDARDVAQVLLSACCGAILAPFPASTIAVEPHRPSASICLPCRKGPDATADNVAPAQPAPIHATLANLHTHVHVLLSATEPSQQAFSDFVQDRVTETSIAMAPELLALLRALTRDGDPARVEIVSGYRSWKLNEMLRKKGRNVSSDSRHCLGQALDFRIEGLESKQLALKIEGLAWKGGLAYYPNDSDRFVHADVGPNRRWRGR